MVAGDLRDAETTVFLHFRLSSALLNSSGYPSSVHSSMLSIHYFFCRPLFRWPGTVPCITVLVRLLCRVWCPNQASFLRFTVVSRGSCGPARTVISCKTSSLVQCSVYDTRSSFLENLASRQEGLASTRRSKYSNPAGPRVADRGKPCNGVAANIQ